MKANRILMSFSPDAILRSKYDEVHAGHRLAERKKKRKAQRRARRRNRL